MHHYLCIYYSICSISIYKHLIKHYLFCVVKYVFYIIYKQLVNRYLLCLLNWLFCILDEHNVLITLVLINSWEILLSEFPQALDINPCPSIIVCNICEVMNVSGDILNDDKNVEDKYEYEFTGSFFK